MPTDLQRRTQYLALAEFCQGIISSLWDYVDGTAPLPKEILEGALKALRSVKSGDSYKFGQRPAAALGSYEQVRTLEEVLRTPQQFEDAIAVTADLLSDPGVIEDETKVKAKKVIELFSKLQTKALWNFEQPKQTAPPDIGELCKALETT
jgi:hypothetical protein